jgi:hypothetical protein
MQQVWWDRYKIPREAHIEKIWPWVYQIEIQIGKARWNYITANSNFSFFLHHTNWSNTIGIYDFDNNYVDTINISYIWQKYNFHRNKWGAQSIRFQYDGKMVEIKLGFFKS